MVRTTLAVGLGRSFPNRSRGRGCCRGRTRSLGSIPLRKSTRRVRGSAWDNWRAGVLRRCSFKLSSKCFDAFQDFNKAGHVNTHAGPNSPMRRWWGAPFLRVRQPLRPSPAPRNFFLTTPSLRQSPESPCKGGFALFPSNSIICFAFRAIGALVPSIPARASFRTAP